MPDELTIATGKAVLTTEEGQRLERPESEVVEMFEEQFRPPLDGLALPDGIKFIRWRRPLLLVVHQSSPMVRQLHWIADDSPADFGPETKYDKVRLSMPYAVTFAVFYCRLGRCRLLDRNELYFTNKPICFDTDQHLCFPALLNVSRIETPRRILSWICTQYLQRSPAANWSDQLQALLDHTWNGGFNRSSEHHEGLSMYGFSEDVSPKIHPIQRWEKASKDEAFALRVKWKPVSHSIAELMDMILAEHGAEEHLTSNAVGSPEHHLLAHHLLQRQRFQANPVGIVAQFLNHIQRSRTKKNQDRENPNQQT